jgi:hypothetical protein
VEEKRRSNIESHDKAVALYHLVYADEGFEESAQVLFRLVLKGDALLKFNYSGKYLIFKY